MTDVVFSMTADEKDVVRALGAVGTANNKLREDIAHLVAASKRAGDIDSKLAQSRLAAADAILGKQKELRAAQEQLAQDLKAGKIDADQYKKSFDGLAKETNALTGELNHLRAQVREDSEDFKRAAAIIEKNEDATDKYARRVRELDRLKAKGAMTSKEYAQALAAEQAELSETGEAAAASGGMIGGLTTKMTAFVGGLTSAGAVIAFLKSEYDALIERQGKSRDANISLAAEQEALLMNLGDASAKDVTGQIRSMSKQSGVKEENLTRAVNESMAARGDLDIKDVMAAVGTASKVRKFAPSELAGLASATIDTQKQTGLGTDASLGFLMQMQAQSRTKNLKGLAENFTPAVGGVMNFGADRQTAGAMLASLSHGMGDTTGAATGTSAIQLAKQLREFSGGKDIGETITNLQNDKGMREKFLAGASFEAKALPAIESLLSGGTQAQQFSAARKALSSDPTETLRQAIGNRDLPALNLAQQDQALANAVDQQKLDDVAGGSAAINRDRIKEFRQQAGNMGLSTTIKGYADDLISGGGMSSEQTIRAMQREIDELKSGKTAVTTGVNSLLGSGAAGIAVSSFMESRNASSEETKKQVEFLQQLVDLTKQQLEQTNQKAHAGIVANRAANPENK